MEKSEASAGLLPSSGIVSPSLHSNCAAGTVTIALPLYRQEQEFQRIGVPVSR